MTGITMPNGIRPIVRRALDPGETASLLRKRTSENEMDAFLGNLGLVLMLLPRFAGSKETKDDLFQMGCLGLQLAVKRFDPEKGLAFSTYAVPTIRGTIFELLGSSGPVHVPKEKRARQKERQDPQVENAMRPPKSLDMPSSLDEDTPLMDSLPSADDPIGDLLARMDLETTLRKLEKQDRRLLFCRYQMELSQEKTGQMLGMNQKAVSRREKKLLEYLRKELA